MRATKIALIVVARRLNGLRPSRVTPETSHALDHYQYTLNQDESQYYSQKILYEATMNTEITDGILTFYELFEDDYYKAEFEKRVQEKIKEERKATHINQL